ncbi:hypothetical protein KR032_006598 [Drosophila birchii]|nr:hypothetical protein KR032_006598 [Drosophila birchii]
MLQDKSSAMEMNRVSLICSEGVLLATNSRNHIICLLDERIYCCAPHTNYYRDIVQEVAVVVDYQTQNRNQKVTVAQMKDMLYRKYEPSDSMDILLAGQDREGLHIYNMGPNEGSTRLMYAAKGNQGVEDAYQYLTEHWQETMNIQEAEKLARKVLQVGDNDYLDMCLIYKTATMEADETIQEEYSEVLSPVMD